MDLEKIIKNISKIENIKEDELKKNIYSFEKYIKSQVKKYDDKSGLEDFKMNKYDYTILYHLYNNTTRFKNKVYILLLYMYSFYKLDGIDFDKRRFPLNSFFDFLNNNDNIHSLMLNLLK